MKHVLLFAAALTIGSAALAQGDYPRCSRDLKDHCVQDQSRARDTRHGDHADGMMAMDHRHHDGRDHGHHHHGHQDGHHHHHMH